MGYVISGSTGVTLFFVLSGFLLSLPWLRHSTGERANPPYIGNFYAARALRVLPLYQLAVVFAIVMSGNVPAGLQAAVFGFVGFDIFPYSVVWWTLSTEVQFYLILPICFMAWLRGGIPRALLLVALCTWLYFYSRYVIFDPLPGNNRSFFMTKSIFGRLPAFLIGIAAARIYLGTREWSNRISGSKWTRLSSLAVLLATVAALGKVLQITAVMGDWSAEQSWHIHHTLEGAFWSIIILLLLLTNPFGKSVLINRPMAITGKLSYSIYLNHVPILFYIIYPVKDSLGGEIYLESAWLYLCPLLGLLLSLALAFLTYRFIELPFLKLKHKHKLPTKKHS
jgi:peptidoglycan/LPS O-acetylase OafA/YrhL